VPRCISRRSYPLRVHRVSSYTERCFYSLGIYRALSFKTCHHTWQNMFSIYCKAPCVSWTVLDLFCLFARLRDRLPFSRIFPLAYCYTLAHVSFQGNIFSLFAFPPYTLLACVRSMNKASSTCFKMSSANLGPSFLLPTTWKTFFLA